MNYSDLSTDANEASQRAQLEAMHRAKAPQRAQYQASAIGVGADVAYGAPGFAEGPPPSLISDVAVLLQTLSGILDDANGSLGALRDRLFGSAPTNGASSATNKPMGQASELLLVLDTIIDRASQVREHSYTLNSRI